MQNKQLRIVVTINTLYSGLARTHVSINGVGMIKGYWLSVRRASGQMWGERGTLGSRLLPLCRWTCISLLCVSVPWRATCQLQLVCWIFSATWMALKGVQCAKRTQQKVFIPQPQTSTTELSQDLHPAPKIWGIGSSPFENKMLAFYVQRWFNVAKLSHQQKRAGGILEVFWLELNRADRILF